MSTLHEALRRVPPETRFRCLAAIAETFKTAAELLDGPDESGYEARRESYWYGRKERWVIASTGPFSGVIFREERH